MFTALAISLIALAVGAVGWFRPVLHNNQPPPKPAYTDQQTAQAKANVCAAFEKLERAVNVVNAVPEGTTPNSNSLRPPVLGKYSMYSVGIFRQTR